MISNAITFATGKDGKTYVAGSCNYKYNPTISVPDSYIKPSQSSSYYFEKYNNLLTEEGIKKMKVSEKVAEELRKLNNAVSKTREKAEYASKVPLVT